MHIPIWGLLDSWRPMGLPLASMDYWSTVVTIVIIVLWYPLVQIPGVIRANEPGGEKARARLIRAILQPIFIVAEISVLGFLTSLAGFILFGLVTASVLTLWEKREEISGWFVDAADCFLALVKDVKHLATRAYRILTTSSYD